MIPGWGLWYSPSLSYRFQTEALLHGSLAVRNTPYAHLHDWAWGNGMQQAWGLGVPILRLPFEILAKTFGLPGFPDRVTFLVYFSLTTWLVWSFLKEASDEVRLTYLILLCFSPIFLTLCSGRFAVYEECIAYGHLWTVLLLALAYRYHANPSPFSFRILSITAGLGCLIRPTLLGPGFIALALCLVFFFSASGMRIGLFLFSIGPSLLLLTNFLRFGSPLEFGQGLQLTIDSHDFCIRFGYPYATEPISSAAIELFASLFLFDGVHDSTIYPHLSRTFRYREFSFASFGIDTLAVLILSWLMLFIAWRQNKLNPLTRFGFAWSFITFFTLFFFFMYHPGLYSRYLGDFTPAISLGIAVGLHQLLNLQNSRRASLFIVMALFGWILCQAMLKIETPLGNSDRIDRIPTAWDEASGPSLPARYQCQDPNLPYRIPHNGSGWATRGSCQVSAETTLFFKDLRCVEIQFEETQKNGLKTPVQAKLQLENLTPVLDQNDGANRVMRFCRNKITTSGFQRLSIGWGTKENLRAGPYPIKLFSVTKID